MDANTFAKINNYLMIVFLFLFLFLFLFSFLVYKAPNLFPVLRDDLKTLLFVSVSAYTVPLKFDLLWLLVFVPVLCLILKYIILLRYSKIFDEVVLLAVSPSNMDRYFYIYLLGAVLMFAFAGDISDPRASYEMLVADNRSGGVLLVFLKLYIIVGTGFCYRLRNALLLLCIAIFIGSKGVLIYVLIVYFSYMIALNKLSIKDFGKFVIVMCVIMYLALSMYTHGVADLYEYYLYSYFDYLDNFSRVYEVVPIFPTMHIVPWLNDILPGVSRIIGISKNMLHYELFPYEMSLGKAPGMLWYENYFRVGLLFFSIFYFVDFLVFVFFVKVSYAIKNVFIVRMIYMSGSTRFFGWIALAVYLLKGLINDSNLRRLRQCQ